MIEEQKDNITSDEKTKLEGLIKDLKNAVSAKNVDKINEIEAALNTEWNTISQRVYANQQQTQQTQTNTTTDEAAAEEAASENIQDADFEEVK